MIRKTDDGRVIPKGVTFDKERKCWRATYKGWSIKCFSFDAACEKRRELVRAGKPHHSYLIRNKK